MAAGARRPAMENGQFGWLRAGPPALRLTLRELQRENLRNRIPVARDVVPLDLKLPKLGGLDLLREIRANPRHERSPSW